MNLPRIDADALALCVANGMGRAYPLIGIYEQRSRIDVRLLRDMAGGGIMRSQTTPAAYVAKLVETDDALVAIRVAGAPFITRKEDGPDVADVVSYQHNVLRLCEDAGMQHTIKCNKELAAAANGGGGDPTGGSGDGAGLGGALGAALTSLVSAAETEEASPGDETAAVASHFEYYGFQLEESEYGNRAALGKAKKYMVEGKQYPSEEQMS
jgi:hypothetical protein